MTANLKKLVTILLAIFLELGIGINSSAFASGSQNIESLDSINREAFVELGITFKENFKKIYPNYKIFSYCIGSFKDDAINEYALGIVDLQEKKAQYVVILDNFTKKAYGIHLANFILGNFGEKSKIGPMVTCNSAMEIKRLRGAIKDSEGIQGDIKPINHFDSICTVDDPDGFDNTCYSYDHKKGKFVIIGGWET